jgi:hypothetical protein
LGEGFGRGLYRLKQVFLPVTLEKMGPGFFRSSGLERLDLSTTKVVKLGERPCGGCSRLGEMVLPPALAEIGPGCFCGSALERPDLLWTKGGEAG